MNRVSLSAPKDEFVLRKWRSEGRKWRVTLVGGLWRLEEKVAGHWCMARPDHEASALLDAFVGCWVGNLRVQHKRAQAEQRAAIVGGDIAEATRWGTHVRSLRTQIAALPEPWNEASKEAA